MSQSDGASDGHSTVMDIEAEQVGKTYGEAIIAAAQKENAAEAVVADLNRLVDDYLGGSRELSAALGSPRVSVDEKLRIIDRVFGGDFHPLLVKFLKVMAGRERLQYLSAVASAATEMIDSMMNRAVAMITTAVPLDDHLRGEIQNRLSQTLHQEVRLKESVDPDLIGGMVIRVGDRVYDSSVKNRLERIGRKTKSGFATQLMQRFDQFTNS
ncbi:MAG: ATP synthase F1 subunit delta [Planctomycetota bacterium]